MAGAAGPRVDRGAGLTRRTQSDSGGTGPSNRRRGILLGEVRHLEAGREVDVAHLQSRLDDRSQSLHAAGPSAQERVIRQHEQRPVPTHRRAIRESTSAPPSSAQRCVDQCPDAAGTHTAPSRPVTSAGAVRRSVALCRFRTVRAVGVHQARVVDHAEFGDEFGGVPGGFPHRRAVTDRCDTQTCECLEACLEVCALLCRRQVQRADMAVGVVGRPRGQPPRSVPPHRGVGWPSPLARRRCS